MQKPDCVQGPTVRAAARAKHIGMLKSLDDLAKRLFDLVIGSCLLVLFSPVLVVVAAALFLHSGPSVLFTQLRIGRGGVPFTCLKFRTMEAGGELALSALLVTNSAASSDWMARQKITNDPRVTSLGRVLRRWGLDELPQLFNVIRGEMSLVGPRPIVAEELARYGAFAPSYQSVRPGITGLWQVSRDYASNYDARVSMDVAYARNRSLMLDVAILVKTLPSLLKTPLM
ncbi:MAG: sugar transferase [Devosiaceae bacterium]